MTDASGNTTFDYDNRGRLFEKTSTINGHSFTLTYGFSLANRLTAVTYPTGRSVTYTRNSTGKAEEVFAFYDSITTILMNNFSYLPFGPAAYMDTGTGSAVINVFDEFYRMTVANPGGQTERFYTYNANGNITNIDVTNNQSKNQAFTYDPLNRLLTASGIYGSIGYTYDKVGNRLIRTVNDDTETCSYISGTNKLQEITGSNPATFAYDTNGNTTGIGGITLIYDQNNRLIRAKEDSNVLGEYTYNGLGQRVIKQAGGVTTLFFYDFSGNLVGESLSNGTVSSEYIYMGESRLARVNSINNVIYYDCNDHLGTPQVITDENGVGVWEATYRPFGEAQVDPNSRVVNNCRFPGQYYDQETGLQYNYFRDYHPGIGRYVEPDPIGLEGGINLYAYCFNDSVNLIDPSGQFGAPGIVIGAASGALAGFAAGMQSGKLWAGIVGGTAGGIIGGAIGFAFPPASSVVGGMIGGAVAGASGGAVGGMVGKRLSDPNASNKEMFIATAKGAGIGLLTGGTAGGLGTAALGAGATALTADLAGTMASTPIAMGLGMIEIDSGLDKEDDLGSTIPGSIKYTLNIYTSSDTVDRNNNVNVWVDSDGKACPPYSWSVSGTGFHFNSASGPTTATTNADLQTLQLWADGTACGPASITVTDDCDEVTSGVVRCLDASDWVLKEQCNSCYIDCSTYGCPTCTAPSDYIIGEKKWVFFGGVNSIDSDPDCPRTWQGPGCSGSCSHPPTFCGNPYECAGGIPCYAGGSCLLVALRYYEWECQ
jgi:RHS repeat-associated protein